MHKPGLCIDSRLMRRQTRCVGHEAGFGNDPSELQAKSTSIRERSSSLGQTIHRPRRDDRRSSPYQAQCSGTFVDDASAIGFWERLVQVNRLAIQANSFTEMECVFVGSGRIVAKQEVAVICVTHTPGVLTSPRKNLVISRHIGTKPALASQITRALPAFSSRQ